MSYYGDLQISAIISALIMRHKKLYSTFSYPIITFLSLLCYFCLKLSMDYKSRHLRYFAVFLYLTCGFYGTFLILFRSVEKFDV